MEHTDECQACEREYRAKHDAYVEKWPHYCRECGATGVQVGIDYVPYGATSVSMETTDLCSCVDAGLCPRCKQPAWDWEQEDPTDSPLECPRCHWREDEPAHAAPPEHYECLCGREWEKVLLPPVWQDELEPPATLDAYQDVDLGKDF